MGKGACVRRVVSAASFSWAAEVALPPLRPAHGDHGVAGQRKAIQSIENNPDEQIVRDFCCAGPVKAFGSPLSRFFLRKNLNSRLANALPPAWVFGRGDVSLFLKRMEKRETSPKAGGLSYAWN